MSKKVLNTEPLINELKGQSAFFKRNPSPQSTKIESEPVTEVPAEGEHAQKPIDEQTNKVTQKSTQGSDISRDTSSANPRKNSLLEPRNLPTREEIQEFSFHLRDELKVKVQAEVPHLWQKELEE